MSSLTNTLSDRAAFRVAEGVLRHDRPAPAADAGIQAASHGPLLETRNLAKSYGGLAALAGVDLALSHSITGLIGPNGAGKTTLLNIVSGVERPGAGEVRFLGENITTLPPHRLATRGLVRTFQISRELTSLTVLENVLLARPRQTGERLLGLFTRGAAVRREEEAAIEAARATLTKVNLWRHADAPAGSLSGGQKKLLELARAMMLAPRLILLDEPAAGVAPAMEEILIATIRGLTKEGTGFLIIEHDLEVIAALSDHVYVMAGGKILTEGSFAEVTADARVVEAYLGLKP